MLVVFSLTKEQNSRAIAISSIIEKRKKPDPSDKDWHGSLIGYRDKPIVFGRAFSTHCKLGIIYEHNEFKMFIDGYRHEILRTDNKDHYPVMNQLIIIAGYSTTEEAFSDKWSKLKKTHYNPEQLSNLRWYENKPNENTI